METTSRLTGKIHKASQGGLTPPKLYDSGADFRIEFAENTEGRQVRISCIFVAHHFCARVKSRIVSSSVYHCIPLYTFVAYHRIPSYTIVYHRIPYPLQWKMTLPVENDRTPLQWKMTPPVEIILLTLPWELCKVILSSVLAEGDSL